MKGHLVQAEEMPFRTSGQSQFKQPVQPSPYVQAFMKSTFKHQSLNDSLDKLQREFMQGYNDVMMVSDPKDMKLSDGFKRQSDGFKGGLKEENEMLQN